MRARQASVSCVGVTERARIRAAASARLRDARSSEACPRAAHAAARVRANPRRVIGCIEYYSLSSRPGKEFDGSQAAINARLFQANNTPSGPLMLNTVHLRKQAAAW